MRYLRNALASLGAAALVTAVGVANASATTPRTDPAVADATIVQGLPKTPLDVYLNGTEVIQDFRFKGVVGPLPLLPGRYHVAIRLHGSKPGSKPLLSGTGVLVAGENITIVADLTATGNPDLTAFWNPNPELASGRAELIVRNVAEDAGLNVYAGGLRIFRDLTNPNGGNIRLPSEWVNVRMTPFGSDTTVIGPVAVHLRDQTVTIVYAIGSAATDTLTSVQQTYSAS